MNRLQYLIGKERNGFTLVEVLAAIVIISVILIGVVNLFNFTNKTAYSNNAKLVSINLAIATLERIKVEPEQYFQIEDIVEPDKTYIYTSKNCPTGNEGCISLYKPYVNDQTYEVELKLSQSTKEKQLQLINTVVTVTLVDENDRQVESTVEGYLNLMKVNSNKDDHVNN